MNDDRDQTKESLRNSISPHFLPKPLIHDRREGQERRHSKAEDRPKPADKAEGRPERRERKERRRRVDPTTFEKQYTDDELEFMNAMQRFKERSGKPFPTHGEVLRVAAALGYRKLVIDDPGTTGAGSESLEAEVGEGLGVEFLAATEAATRQRT